MRSKLLLMVALVALAAMAAAQTKTSGTASFTKPEPMYSIEVGDHAGHSLYINKAACTWTKGMEIAGLETKDGHDVTYGDVKGNKAHVNGYHISNMSNGDKIYVRFQGTDTMKDGKMETSEGTWSYIGGTGKLKGIKGKGTYKGKPDAAGNMVYAIEGEYELPAAKK